MSVPKAAVDLNDDSVSGKDQIWRARYRLELFAIPVAGGVKDSANFSFRDRPLVPHGPHLFPANIRSVHVHLRVVNHEHKL